MGERGRGGRGECVRERERDRRRDGGRLGDCEAGVGYGVGRMQWVNYQCVCFGKSWCV